MIGIPLAASISLLLAGMAVGLTSDATPTASDAAARRLVVERAAQAGRTLRDLEAALLPAVDAVRAGAARAVSGEEPPGPPLEEAAARGRAAEEEASRARSALEALEGARLLVNARSGPLAGLPPSGTLPSIAAQLETTAAAAQSFAEMRRRADRITDGLDGVLSALGRDDLSTAERLVDEARDDHEALAAWEVGMATLPVWLETVDETIGAVDAIVEASRAGDVEAAQRAADALAELSDDAAPADRALRIAIGEGGSALVAAPMGRLAEFLDAVAEARTAVAAVAGDVGG